MLRFVADENFNQDIIRGLIQRNPSIDIVSVQDAGMSGSSDPRILEWAAQIGGVLLTHDASTMTRHAYDRVRAGSALPGVFEVPERLATGRVIEDLILLAEYSFDDEWEGQVLYLPLR